MKYFVFSNINSNYFKLIKSLNENGFDLNSNEHKIIFCGDLFDKGDNAKELEEFVTELIKKDKVIIIKGIHEDVAIDFFKNYKRYVSDIKKSPYWVNGTFQTFLDLTNTTYDEAVLDLETFIQKAKQTNFYKTIIPAMKEYYETNNYVFVYGWMPLTPKTRTYDENWRKASKLRWIYARYYGGFIKFTKDNLRPKDKIVVCQDGTYSYYKKLDDDPYDCARKIEPKDFEGKIIPLDARISILDVAPCLILED